MNFKDALTLLFCFGSFISFAQNKLSSHDVWSMGSPLIQNYKSETYNANPQNWDIVEGENGYMYFANTSGVLEFDGHHWRLIPMDNYGIARSFAQTEDGTIYIGGVG